MINPELLKLLVCPENKTALHEADAALLAKVNAAVAAGTLKNRADEVVKDPAEGGLIREDGTMMYIVRDDIPVMLIDEAIPLEQLS
jgi:uncharacterized protein